MNYEEEIKTLKESLQSFAAQAKREIASLAGETIALQWIITQVLSEIRRDNPTLTEPIKRGFDNAASYVEQYAISVGKMAMPEQSVKALRIVEELRTATLGDHDKPRHGV
jgi:hypothetical protein